MLCGKQRRARLASKLLGNGAALLLVMTSGTETERRELGEGDG